MSVRFSESCGIEYPSHDISRLPSVCKEETFRNLGDDGTRSPSAASHKSISFSVHSTTPLHPCGPRSETYHQMVKSERKIAEHAERSRTDNFARELYDKLVKVSRQLSREKEEDEEAKSKLITELQTLPGPC